MNTNRLEKELASWVPRRPSAGIKDRIFSTNVEPAGTRLKGLVFSYLKAHVFGSGSLGLPQWVKFAPACCIPLIIMLLSMGSQERRHYLAMATGSNTLAGLSSNLTAFCCNDTQHQENVWSGLTFDWTKDGHTLSTIGSYSDGKTNRY